MNMAAVIAYVRTALPDSVCLVGHISGRFRVYRNGGDRSSYVGTGANEIAAWLSAASYVAGRE